MEVLATAAEKVQAADERARRSLSPPQTQQQQQQQKNMDNTDVCANTSYSVVTKLYGCGVCSTFKPSKRNNVEQHIWQKHSEQHGGESHMEKYRASKHKQIVAPFLRPIYESEVAPKRTVFAEPLSIVPRLPAQTQQVEYEYAAKSQGYHAAIISPPSSASLNESQQYMEYDSYRYSPKAAQNTPHIYSTPPLSSTMNTNQEPSGYMSVSPVPPASASYADTRQQQQHFQHSPDYNGQRIAYSRQESYPLVHRRAGYASHHTHGQHGPSPYPFHMRGVASHTTSRPEHYSESSLKVQPSPRMNIQSSPNMAGLETGLQGLLRPGHEQGSPRSNINRAGLNMKAGWSSPARYERTDEERLSPDVQDSRRHTLVGEYGPSRNFHGSVSADGVDAHSRSSGHWPQHSYDDQYTRDPRSLDSITPSPRLHALYQSSTSMGHSNSSNSLSAPHRQVFTFSPSMVNRTSPRPGYPVARASPNMQTLPEHSTGLPVEAAARDRDQMLLQPATEDCYITRASSTTTTRASVAPSISQHVSDATSPRVGTIKRVLVQLEQMGAIEIRRPIEKWPTAVIPEDVDEKIWQQQQQQNPQSPKSNEQVSTPKSSDSSMWRPF